MKKYRLFDLLRAAAATWAATACSSAATPATGKVKAPVVCRDPKPLVVGGVDLGVDRCAQGGERRRAAVACPSYVPNPTFVCDTTPPKGDFACTTDADCAAFGGPCVPSPAWGYCYCQGGCKTDADCGEGKVCLCGELFGQCVPATCTTSADCAVGDCVTYETTPGCGTTALACQTAGDQCVGWDDCPSSQHFCTVDPAKSSGAHLCSGTVCAIGRPFEVDGTWRTAEAVARDDWQPAECGAMSTGLSADVCAAAAAYWREAARMEHASVASFARLTLDLLAVGAPPELLAASQQAGLDEVHHARLCFGLARYFGGAAVGPGPLTTTGALQATSLLAVAVAAAREGCVWETLAALEAQVAAAQAHDTTVAAALATIAEDEARHAELAWDVVRWAVQTGGAEVQTAVAAAFEDELARVAADASSVSGQTEAPAAELGVLSATAQARLRAHGVAAVVRPALARLLGEAPTSLAS